MEPIPFKTVLRLVNAACWIMAVQPAFAAIGNDPVSDVPDAVCVLKSRSEVLNSLPPVSDEFSLYYDSTTCGATLVRVPGSRKPKIVTAGHCSILEQDLRTVAAVCGCGESNGREGGQKCKETFQLSNVSRSIVRCGSRWCVDHAIADVDHMPVNGVEPAGMATGPEAYSAYFDAEGGVLPGVRCIKGGMGRTMDRFFVNAPRYYPLECGVRAPTPLPPGLPMRGSVDAFIDERLGIVSENDVLLERRYIEMEIPDIQEWDVMTGLLMVFHRQGVFSSTFLFGDSGSGMFCKRESEPYRLVAINSHLGFMPSGPEQLTIYNRYTLLPDTWSPVYMETEMSLPENGLSAEAWKGK